MQPFDTTFRSVSDVPAGGSADPLGSLATGARGSVKITAIKALQPKRGATLIRIETDAGIFGYGPCNETGPVARGIIDSIANGRLPHLWPVGKDPLSIGLHHHNLFYAYPQRARNMRLLSGVDIALWDLAGKILGQPVHKLLGGPFRDEIPLYSHLQGGDVFERSFWRDRAQEAKSDPNGFKAFKIDIHHPLGVKMQETITSISPADARKVALSYALAREELGDEIDIIVHCHAELDVPSAIRVAEAVEPIKPLFYEDPLDPTFSESWLALRRATRLPITTGENLALAEAALPFLQSQAVNYLQPDLMNAGGITGTKLIADLAALYRIPICLHNVSGYALNMASQQVSAALFNCPMMECVRTGNQAPEAASNAPIIKDGKMKVSALPGLGIDLDEEYLKANRAEGEPWWD